MCVYKFAQCVEIYTPVYIYRYTYMLLICIYVYIYREREGRNQTKSIHTSLYVHIHIYIYKYKYSYIYIYIYIYSYQSMLPGARWARPSVYYIKCYIRYVNNETFYCPMYTQCSASVRMREYYMYISVCHFFSRPKCCFV